MVTARLKPPVPKHNPLGLHPWQGGVGDRIILAI